MCYIRGHARDYDIWRQLGNVGWSWDDVLPYFKSIEKYPHGANDVARRRRRTVRAGKSPALGESWKPGSAPPSSTAFRETNDHNTGDNEGICYFEGTIRNGRRSSAAQAFLHPVMTRPNLRVLTNAHAKELRLEGKRAVGVEFWQGNELEICAGARAR